MRFFFALLISLFTAPFASAQNNESWFESYAAYEAFVDENMKQRNVIPLLNRLGGRDEYTPEQMASTDRQFQNIWSRDFERMSMFRIRRLEGGFSQEARAYWVGGQYGYFYALLHQRGEEVIVLHFSFHTSPLPVLEKF